MIDLLDQSSSSSFAPTRADDECDLLIASSHEYSNEDGEDPKRQAPRLNAQAAFSWSNILPRPFMAAQSSQQGDWLSQHGAASRHTSDSFYNIFTADGPPAAAPPRKILRPYLRCRPTLICLLFILVAIITTMFLIKLSVLVSDQRRTMEATVAPQTVDLVEHYIQPSRDIHSGWIVAGSKCHIPKLDPWDKSIKSYVWRKDSFDCAKIAAKFNVSKSLTFVTNNQLHFTEEALEAGAPKTCCYREVSRPLSSDSSLDVADNCQSFIANGTLSMPTSSQIIKIECNQFNYTNYHSFVRHDIEEETAMRRVAAAKLKPDEHYNILMVGVDTVSRLDGYRQLNETLTYLRSQADYRTLEFFGYNKVGENTFPNLIPLLTGLTPKQLGEIACWQSSGNDDSSDSYLDNCKYMWNFYQQVGYMTYYSEDWPKASTFNYLKPGFRTQPTAFYGRPFTLARDPLLLPPVSMGCASCQRDRPIVETDLENLRSFIRENHQLPFFAFHWINCPQHDDLNGASQADLILKRFFESTRELTVTDRTFVIFFSDHGYRWNNFVSTRIGHYESSLPLLTIAPPKRFIERHPNLYENLKLHQPSLLTPFDMFRTLIDIRNLALKERPERGAFKRSALQVPTTEPPTAATTISQLIQPDGLSCKQKFTTLSILRVHTQAQLDRSCEEAGIPDNYCVCNVFETVPTDSLDVLGAAYHLVYTHMNAEIRKRLDICHLLDLGSIEKAEVLDFEKLGGDKQGSEQSRKRRTATSVAVNTSDNKRPTTTRPPPLVNDSKEKLAKNITLSKREYNLVLKTQPGGGLFREVVRFYGDDMSACKTAVRLAKTIIDSEASSMDEKTTAVVQMNAICHFSVHSDSIMRLNIYRDQSKCVTSGTELKKICYCNDLLQPKL